MRVSDRRQGTKADYDLYEKISDVPVSSGYQLAWLGAQAGLTAPSPSGEEGADKSGANRQGQSPLSLSNSAPLAGVLQCR